MLSHATVPEIRIKVLNNKSAQGLGCRMPYSVESPFIFEGISHSTLKEFNKDPAPPPQLSGMALQSHLHSDLVLVVLFSQY